MTKPMYDAIALTLSYAFMLLSVVIVICGAAWMRSERKSVKAALASTDAGIVGYLSLVDGKAPRINSRTRIPVPVEGTIGRSKACDVFVATAELPPRAARATLTQSGMLLSPVGSGVIRVNGEDYRTSVLLDDDSRIEWGSLTFQLRLIPGAESLAAAAETPRLDLEQEAPSLRRLFRVRHGSPLDDAEESVSEETDENDEGAESAEDIESGETDEFDEFNESDEYEASDEPDETAEEAEESEETE